MIKYNMIPNQYKTTQQFNSITKELIINKNNLIIIHINIRSLTQNLDKLRKFIDTLIIKPHIICLSETWLNSNNDFNNNITNYTYQTNYRQKQNKCRGGGVKDIQYELIKDLTFNITDYLETLTIEIKLKKNKKIIMSSLSIKLQIL